MTDRIGFVGIGLIGRPLVESMLRAGLRPTVFDVDPRPLQAVVAKGAAGAASVAEVARASDVVGICVPADAHVRSVLEGTEGLLANMSAGAVVAIHSTVLPETISWAAETAARHGVRIVEACLTGGHFAAKEGRTTFLLGGAPEDIEALAPILSACGDTLVQAGPLGNANLLKLCLNLQTYVAHLGIAEAVRLAKDLEVPVAGLKEAMRANGQLGEMTKSFFGLHELSDEIIADGNILPMRRTSAAIIVKDLELMRLVALQNGIDLPARDMAASEFYRTYRLPEDEPDSAAAP
ncbi:MAG: NAD(P)-binding domain-containing protein [Acidimicrobiales bacterium]|jgi:3-hydroxyisobutyrate dehydrogenase